MKELIGTGKELTRRAVLEEMKKNILLDCLYKQRWLYFDRWAQDAGFQADAWIFVNKKCNLYNYFILKGNEWFIDWLIKHGFAVEEKKEYPVRISAITEDSFTITIDNKHKISFSISALDERMDEVELRKDHRIYCIQRVD
uniref:Uncharacterized protein n=1 Tax=viral metagenome TaxID=1070528 RepID=A0A6H1ZC88_9ZZZZ